MVLNTDEEGVVVEIMTEKMVMIEVNKVRFPVYTDQIDFPYFKMFTQQRNIQKQKVYVDALKAESKKGDIAEAKQGMYVSFVPVFEKDVFDDPIVEKIKIYLVNHSAVVYNFSYELCYAGKSGFELKNTIQAKSEFYLHDIPFENFNDNPRFDFEFSLAKADKNKVPYYHTSLKFKPKQFFKRLEELMQKSEPVFSDLLFKDYPDKEEEIVLDLNRFANTDFKLYDATKAREHIEPYKAVIDLHIEKLTTDWRRMSNFEMLTLQLRTLEKHIDIALAHHQPHLTVIHGIGEGKLKEEIHMYLIGRKEVKLFENKYNPKYGYGATEIHFKY